MSNGYTRIYYSCEAHELKVLTNGKGYSTVCMKDSGKFLFNVDGKVTRKQAHSIMQLVNRIFNEGYEQGKSDIKAELLNKLSKDLQ